MQNQAVGFRVKVGCKMMELIRKSDALHAVLRNQGDAAVAAVQEIIPIRKIYGYDLMKLVAFAYACEKNCVSNYDLKQAAWNLELAVRAVMNERQEMIENEMKKITMRFTPDFEKAYADMMGKEKDDAAD